MRQRNLAGNGTQRTLEAVSQRRHIVKAPVKKPKAPAKAAARTTAKTVVKTSAKTPAKSPVKTVQKVAVKARPPVKPATRPTARPAAKSAAKAIPKVVKKTAPPIKPGAKPAAKPAARAAPKKPVPAKAAGKPAPAPKVNLKKTPPAPAVKAKAAAPVKTLIAAKPAAPVKPMPAATVPVAPAAAPSNGLPPRPPLKPGRRSSARAALPISPPAPMVPTHAPDAAKASYSTMTERVIAPPPHVAAKKDPKLANNWKSKAAEELTDEEVKAMPDAEYMNDKQMAFFRHKLSILKRDIHNSAGETTEHLREDTVVVPDPADRATIEEEHALELRTRDRERKLLKKIEQSIARIDSGDYGYCDETGEPIGVGRLIARPTANLSLEAQQRRELKQKMFGD
jgi:DnaK suppressor protein